jgi:hypothetical protein
MEAIGEGGNEGLHETVREGVIIVATKIAGLWR